MHHHAAIQGSPVLGPPSGLAGVPSPLRDDRAAPQLVVTRIDRVEIRLEDFPDPIGVWMQRHILDEYDGGRSRLRRSGRNTFTDRRAERADVMNPGHRSLVAQQVSAPGCAGEHHDRRQEKNPPTPTDPLCHPSSLRATPLPDMETYRGEKLRLTPICLHVGARRGRVVGSADAVQPRNGGTIGGAAKGL
jgi:hypothetical protein